MKAKISSNQPEVLDRKLPRPDKIFCFFPIDKIGSYQCQCADGYSGEFCQTKIPYCSTPEFSPCQNGGKCIDHFTHYTCECKLGFAGENCTTNINDTRLKSALRARPRCARMESRSGLTSSTPMVRTHTLDPTPDAPRSYNTPSPFDY